jgi:phosphoribosyl-AMP cyclohydrolase
MANEFAARTSVEQVEEGAELAPKFDADGLIPAVTTDAATGELLMVGYMNAEALRKTIETGEAHYWSRSRQMLWHKGATSGLVQKVVELMIDDDQDCVWLKVGVAGSGASCHVGYRTCFYRRIPLRSGSKKLEFTEKEKVRLKVVYGDALNRRSLNRETVERRGVSNATRARALKRKFIALKSLRR